MTALNVDAIVNSTDESMTSKYPVCERIYHKAGPQLKTDIKNLVKGVRYISSDCFLHMTMPSTLIEDFWMSITYITRRFLYV